MVGLLSSAVLVIAGIFSAFLLWYGRRVAIKLEQFTGDKDKE